MRYNNITDVPGIKVGLVTEKQAVTGCTVILVEQGAVGGVSVKGGAPGTRETDLLSPLNRVEQVHAIVLSGGSAYGLETAGGVMSFLDEKKIGLKIGSYQVPIVPAAIIFDLFIGDGKVRPTAAWGYEAARQAREWVFPEGSSGAGTGATAAKLLGMSSAIKAGQASLSSTLGGKLVVGVLVVVNALGDLYNEGGSFLAGPRDLEKGVMKSSMQLLQKGQTDPFFENNYSPGANTTLAVVATNAVLSKADITRVADAAHNGLARVIRPFHTSWDGDTVFALATGEVPASGDLVGITGAELLAKAVPRALGKATGLGGIPSLQDL